MMAAVARLRGTARVCWFPGHGHESDRAGGRRPRARLLRASPLFSSAVMIRRRRRIIEPAQREQCAFDPSDLAQCGGKAALLMIGGKPLQDQVRRDGTVPHSLQTERKSDV